MKRTAILSALILATPLVALAQTAQVKSLNDILTYILNFLNALVPILIAAALVYFLFGLLRFVVAHDAEARKQGLSVIVSGIVVLAVMTSVWGLVNILVNTFSLQSENAPSGPTIPGSRPL